MSASSAAITSIGELDVIRPGRIGVIAIVLSMGTLIAWSYFAPIASAIITPGVVVVENNRRVIQHADGGTVRTVGVQDGSHVSKGDMLLTLDDTRLVTTQQSLVGELGLIRSQMQRLIAEREGATDLASAQPQSVASESAQFYARRNSLLARIELINRERMQTEAAIPGVLEEIEAQATRLHLTEMELRGAAELAKLGAGTRQRVIDIAKVHADIVAALSSLKSREAELQVKIAQAPAEIEKIKTAFIESVEADLHAAERERLDREERLAQVNEQISRSIISSPVSGTIVNLAVHSSGDIIGAGPVIMEIVPDREKLVIESDVRPEDASGIHVGDAIDVRVSGAGSRRTKRLLGIVLSVSADRLTDRLRGNSFFVVKSEVSRTEFESATERTLTPGMAVEVFILRGEKTVIEYLVAPILDFFSKSFRE